MKKRQISGTMMKAFLDGQLRTLLRAVQKDDTLDLELRGDSVNIYYRGGSIFKITEGNGAFPIYFDTNYCIVNSQKLRATPSPDEAVKNLPLYKQAMDWWFHEHPKYEREVQQGIVRENNNQGKISNGTDYYIADIEFQDGNARFDMVALKWSAKGVSRKDPGQASLALIEVKYGDDALKGRAGIAKHLTDCQTFLGVPENVEAFCLDMSQVVAQKCELGLVNGLNTNQYGFTVSAQNPEVIFIFANHNPKSKILPEVIAQIARHPYPFPIMIATASNMGYGLYVEHLQQVGKEK